ncbi:DUF541 domain-containing protein [Flavobacteriaceae bacterium R38]|nr:DUF541 domain-containing protein [Flavobacteriaceae bacterium R38]
MKKTIVLLVTILMTISLQAQNQKIRPTVSVTGKGIVEVTPDRVMIKVRAEHNGKTALEVKKQNDEVIDAVLKLCRKMNIDKKHVNTGRINLNKNYDYQKKTYKYTANQSLNILLVDLDKYEKLMQGLLGSGINRIDGVEFKSSKIEEYKAAARIKAVENAKEKAIAYAGVLNQKIGKAISISENSANDPYYPQPRFKAAISESDSFISETIAVGELKIRTTVSIVFELN